MIELPADGQTPTTYPQYFRELAKLRADQLAIVSDAETLTYAEFDHRSGELAKALLATGAGKGTRIGLLAPDGAYWLIALVAGLRIGALVTLVSTLASPPELAHILRNSDVQFLISARRFLRHDYAKTLEAALPGLTDGRADGLGLDSAPYLRRIWLDDAAGIGWARPFSDLVALASTADAPDASLLAAVEAEVHAGDDAIIIYTSGSTAAPKAVMHTQSSVTRHPLVLSRYFQITAEDKMMSLLPAFWLGGLATTLQVIAVGGTLVYGATPDPEDTLDALVKFGANAVHSWGIRHQKLREAAIARGLDLEKIRGLGAEHDSQGNPIPPHLRVNMMGMSESFSPHSAEPMGIALPEHKPGAAGRAVNGYERRIVDTETGKELPRGQTGEMQIRGGALMSGFYKRSRGEVFTADGFYPTGDLAKIDEDGWAWFLGRRGDMIKTGTANVSRHEVEAALLKLPDVKWAYVAGLPDEELGQLIAAAVIAADGASVTAEGIKSALKELISSYKIPRRIAFIAEGDILMTPTGKLNLAAMSDLLTSKVS